MIEGGTYLAAKGSKGIGLGRVDGDDLIEAADLEHLADGWGEGAYTELAGLTLELASDEEDDPEACAADVGEVFHIKEEGGSVGAEDGFEGILELSGIAAIDPAGGFGNKDRTLVFTFDL